MVNIIVVDRHTIYRHGLCQMLDSFTGVEIVGQASRGDQALSLIESLGNVNMVIFDTSLPDYSGLQFAQALKKTFPLLKLVVNTMTQETSLVKEFILAGVEGYLLKTTEPLELEHAIEVIGGQNKYVSTTLVSKLVSDFYDLNVLKYNSDRSTFDLNANEITILSFISDGLTSQEIGHKLFMSKRTVEGYRRALMDKAKVSNVAQLVRWAFVSGVLS